MSESKHPDIINLRRRVAELEAAAGLEPEYKPLMTDERILNVHPAASNLTMYRYIGVSFLELAMERVEDTDTDLCEIVKQERRLWEATGS